jgi:hypothetical protein
VIIAPDRKNTHSNQLLLMDWKSNLLIDFISSSAESTNCNDFTNQALPLTFSFKDAEETCIRLNLKKDKFKNSLRNKNFVSLFLRKEHGIYAKV